MSDYTNVKQTIQCIYEWHTSPYKDGHKPTTEWELDDMRIWKVWLSRKLGLGIIWWILMAIMFVPLVAANLMLMLSEYLSDKLNDLDYKWQDEFRQGRFESAEKFGMLDSPQKGEAPVVPIVKKRRPEE